MSGEATRLGLRVHVPVACFRNPYARDYGETFPVAPPATLYGMLLSMVGEEDRDRHIGAALTIGRLRHSPVSSVLRTFYRWKDKDIMAGTNRAPDYQELLTDVRLAVWVEDGDEQGDDATLRQRLEAALDDPASVDRFGALCLGESTHLVDGVWRFEQRPIDEDEALELLVPHPRGDLSLPIWADHIGSRGTRWGSFVLREAELPEPGRGVVIQPPD